MKELDLVINKKGFVYTQVFKNDSGYVYEQKLNGRVIAFESFFRRENTMHGCISFPGDNAFGIWAWSCSTIERAISKLTLL
jgi:hypothetical protein